MNHTMLLTAEYENGDSMYQCDTCTCTLFKHTKPHVRIETMIVGDHSVCHHIGYTGSISLSMSADAGTNAPRTGAT